MTSATTGGPSVGTGWTTSRWSSNNICISTCFSLCLFGSIYIHLFPSCTQLEAENEVNNEMANRMSLFYAEATPMLKTLSNATTKFVSEVLLRLSPPSSPVRSSTHFGGRFTIMEKTFCHQFPSVTICQFRRSRNFPTSHLSAFSMEQKSHKDFRGVHKQFRGHVGSEMLFSKVTLRPWCFTGFWRYDLSPPCGRTRYLTVLYSILIFFFFQNKTLPIEDTTDCLSTMACVCRVMLETPWVFPKFSLPSFIFLSEDIFTFSLRSFFVPREYRCRFTNTDTMLFCMRVMVGVIILYDHVHPVGAFAKTSKIDVSVSQIRVK